MTHILGALWVAQSVEHLTLDFGSGHDLMVRGIEPHVRLCIDTVEPAWDSLSPRLSAPPPLACAQEQALSLEINSKTMIFK